MRTDKDTLPIVKEDLIVDTNSVSDGSVRVSTHTDVVRELVEIELGARDVSVERVPVGSVVDVAPQVRVEGDVTIVPVFEERLVVEKRLVLVEEIRITSRKVFRTECIEAELRKQSAVVERIDPHDPTEENLNG